MYTDSNLILTRRTLEYSVYSAIPPNRVTPKATPKAVMLQDKINSIPFCYELNSFEHLTLFSNFPYKRHISSKIRHDLAKTRLNLEQPLTPVLRYSRPQSHSASFVTARDQETTHSGDENGLT